MLTTVQQYTYVTTYGTSGLNQVGMDWINGVLHQVKIHYYIQGVSSGLEEKSGVS